MQNILILEDHPDTRLWLTQMLQLVFENAHITEAASLAQANKAISGSQFDLALVDLNLPDGTGIDFIKTITKVSPKSYIVVATVFDDDAHLFPALEAGAQGYLLKDLSSVDFIDCLKGIIKGEPPVSPAIARKLIAHFNKSNNTDHSDNLTSELSSRESEILSQIAQGLNRTEVAKLLTISPNTVATHLKNIYSKLNITSRAEATLEALRLGLVKSH